MAYNNQAETNTVQRRIQDSDKGRERVYLLSQGYVRHIILTFELTAA